MKKQILKELSNSGEATDTLELMKSCSGRIKPIETSNEREKSQGRNGLRLLKSVNLR